MLLDEVDAIIGFERMTLRAIACSIASSLPLL